MQRCIKNNLKSSIAGGNGINATRNEKDTVITELIYKAIVKDHQMQYTLKPCWERRGGKQKALDGQG